MSSFTLATTFRNRTKAFLRTDRNVKLYSLRQVLERNFMDPSDYVLNEKEIIWSHESQNHPDFAKSYGQPKNPQDRWAFF